SFRSLLAAWPDSGEMKDSVLRDWVDRAEKPKSLYVHLPFCVSKCAYCDFFSVPVTSIPESFQSDCVEKILWRIDDFCSLFSIDEFETIYLGGGTPTCLSDSSFEKLLHRLDSMFGDTLREWTIEANPESLSPGKMEIIEKYRISRLSLGIQSMDDEELKLMGRPGRAVDNRRALSALKSKGISISADLIAAYPEKSGSSCSRRTAKQRLLLLKEAIVYLAEQGLGHLSLYDLTVEDGTPLCSSLQKGKLILEDEDEAYWVRKEAEKELARRGFLRYEVSNFAIPGCESRHNQAYWSMNSYLGAGPGAISTIILADAQGPEASTSNAACSFRMEEGKDIALYLESPDAGMTCMPLSRKDSAVEMVMMGLRTRKGLDENRFQERFGLPVAELFHESLVKWKVYFHESGTFLCLDDAGLDLLNHILIDMLIDIDKSLRFQERSGK
ncbi:MAG: coproporphyrinogen III oxidase family protein, partial [Spirochaetaceae bacterium]|nr:coproporphyrinogen III oxidase family protein [Spirochaetaceae bacterium]